MEAGDIARMLTASALVLFMTPGLALFYGGMVRGKNVLDMLMMSVVTVGVVTVVSTAVGYSLARDGSVGGVVGGPGKALLSGVEVRLGWFGFNAGSALDVVGIHMVGGIVGSLLTGVFVSSAVNPAASDGLWYGGRRSSASRRRGWPPSSPSGMRRRRSSSGSSTPSSGSGWASGRSATGSTSASTRSGPLRSSEGGEP